MAQAPNPPSIRNISQFKSKLRGGGARPNLFEVAIPNFPDFVGASYNNDDKANLRFMCKAANLPASNVAPVEVPFRGRILKVAGDRTFDPWTITIINDEDFRLRTAFEAWMNGVSKLDNATGATAPTSYMQDAYVYQLGRNGLDRPQQGGVIDGPSNDDAIPVLKGYRFYGVFPTNISAIELSYDQPDTIEEFTVDLQVQWWDALDPKGESLFKN